MSAFVSQFRSCSEKCGETIYIVGTSSIVDVQQVADCLACPFVSRLLYRIAGSPDRCATSSLRQSGFVHIVVDVHSVPWQGGIAQLGILLKSRRGKDVILPPEIANTKVRTPLSAQLSILVPSHVRQTDSSVRYSSCE